MSFLFRKGMLHGLPIMLGYLSVSFGFGILAVTNGISVFPAAMISATNLTSAGQAAGITIIAAGGSLIEMAFTQFIINLRYSLIGLSLSQKLDKSFTTPHRLIASFGITDEIFALSYAYPDSLKPPYMYGMILVSFLGWTSGTVLGALAGTFLPQILTSAMGIVLYAMFVAIIIPPAKEKRSVLAVVIISATVSILLYYFVRFISAGFAIIISALVSSFIGTVLFPVKEEME